MSGVTIMRMDEGLDTGPMLLKRELDIRGKNAGQVTDELAELGAEALIDWLEHPTPPQPQPDDGVTYASKIDKAEARIDWSKPAEEIERQVRAFNPVPGAWFEAEWRTDQAAGGRVEGLTPAANPAKCWTIALIIAAAKARPPAHGPARGTSSDEPGRAAARLCHPQRHDPPVTRWRLTIEYDGGPFMGWQRQDHGPSVQQTLEEALRADDRRAGRGHRRGPDRRRSPCAGDERAC